MTIDVDIDIDVFLPAYRHLLDSDCDINFLWGGRDSGKSHFIAQKLILDCMHSSYFRCVLIKKTHESIKDSQWQMLKDVSETWGVSHLFDFNSNPLEIRCVNGNKFISRGCDKAGKLKSIANPSHAWYEEGNQLTLDDFTTVSTTLRNEHVKVQQWFSFNPECEGNYEDFWLYKSYFIDVPYHEVTYRTTTYNIDGEEISIKYSSTHTDYRINSYVKPERKAWIESMSAIDPYKYLVYAKGFWGKRTVDRPYCANFSTDKHVSEKAIYQPNRQIIFSLDFNVEPFVSTASHQWRDAIGEHKHFFRELVIEKNGDVHAMCDLMEKTFGMAAMANAYFTGDATQRKREITQRGNLDAWRIINSRFNLGKRLKVPRANPSVKDNRVLMNTLLAFHPDFLFHPSMKLTIFQMQFTEVDEDGNMVKKNRNDVTQRCDALDDVRYDCNVFLNDYPERYRLK